MKFVLRRFLSVLLVTVILFSVIPTAHGVSAAAFCLMDGDTGEVLSASQEDVELPMASTTKVMTCLVAIREGDLHQTVSVSPKAVDVEGTSIYLQAGEKLSLLDLLYAVMLQSANDASVAVAIAVSDSVEAFVERMNATARSFGLEHTHYRNPHGLPAEEHYSSAKDLCTLLQVALRDEVFADITGTVKYLIPAPDGGKRTLVNHNKLLRSYEECIGGKTGFTRTAGRCLVTAAQRTGKTLICATLNAPDDWNDHKALYSEGFSLYHEVEFCKFAEIRQELPVVGGELYTVPVTNLDGMTGMLRGNEPVEMQLELPRFLYAPLPGVEFATDTGFYLGRAGASVGDAVFYQAGREVARVPLYPMMSVGATPRQKNFFEKVRDWFRSLWERFIGLWKK